MAENILTLEEVAKRLRVSERTILRLLKQQRIKGYKVGRAWRFEPTDVEEYVQHQRKEAEHAA